MEVYEQIKKLLLEGEVEELIKVIDHALKTKYTPEMILEKGLLEGINILAEKFKTKNVFVPEALIMARAMNESLDFLEPYLNKKERYIARAVIGTVEGDIHDIGKNIVKSMLSTINIEVIDLGVDISKNEFIDAIKKYKPQMLIISSLLTTTLKQLKIVIEELKKEGLRDDIIVFVGGAPVTKKYADEAGADYYTDSASDLMEFLKQNINKLII